MIDVWLVDNPTAPVFAKVAGTIFNVPSGAALIPKPPLSAVQYHTGKAKGTSVALFSSAFVGLR